METESSSKTTPREKDNEASIPTQTQGRLQKPFPVSLFRKMKMIRKVFQRAKRNMILHLNKVLRSFLLSPKISRKQKDQKSSHHNNKSSDLIPIKFVTGNELNQKIYHEAEA